MNYRKLKKVYRKTRKNNNWVFKFKNTEIMIIKLYPIRNPISGAIISINKIYCPFSDIKKKLRKYSFIW